MSAIFLFDVDGTLTKPRQRITEDMLQFLGGLREQVHVGVVGGSDLTKVVEQLGNDLPQVQRAFDYVFTENGLIGFKGDEKLPSESILSKLGEEKLQQVIDFCLHYIADLRIPKKRGNFIEFRTGMLNVSPIGRSCSQAERLEFNRYDQEHGIRTKFATALQNKFPDFGLKFSIGGQISIDIFPKGWDKTYCLKYLKPTYEQVFFFGDKTSPGGNDYEIFAHEHTLGHTVNDPEHTVQVVQAALKTLKLQ